MEEEIIKTIVTLIKKEIVIKKHVSEKMTVFVSDNDDIKVYLLNNKPLSYVIIKPSQERLYFIKENLELALKNNENALNALKKKTKAELKKRI